MKSVTLSVLTAAAVAATMVGTTAQARTSTPSEYRGYSTCKQAMESETQGLVASRSYLLDKSGSNNQYYINATHWQNGDRATLKAACSTTANGRALLALEMSEGRFRVDGGNVRIEVASK